MSRIEDALKRITGASTEPRQVSGLDRYAPETGDTKPDERKLTAFASSRPVTVVARPPQKVASPTIPPPVHQVAIPAQIEPDTEPAVSADDEKLIDLRPVAQYLSFAAGSMWRHKALALFTFSLVLAVTVALALLLPRTYHAETKLLAQRNEVIAALSNPGRAVPWDADAPTRAASETILRRENLIALMKETDLMNDWERTRIPLLRFKDWLMSFVRQPPTQEDKLDGLIGLLEQSLVVTAGPVGDGTVTIDLYWPNAQMAYRLVDAAQKAFIEARQKAERAAIGESIGILERYSATLHENINSTLTELQRTQSKSRPAGGRARTTVASQADIPMTADIIADLPAVPDAALGIPALGAELNDPQIPRLRETLASDRLQIAALEEQQQRQLSELRAQLARLTTIYTPAHPMVLSVQQNIAALSRDSPQLASLKAQADNLDAEYKKRVDAVAELQQVEQLKTEFASRTQNAEAHKARPPQPKTDSTEPAPTAASAAGSSDAADFASIRLRLELNQLESVLERTDGARIELAVSDAAFKYRYSVIRPPQVPRSPVRPNIRLIVVAGFIGSLLLGFAAAVGKDLLSDRIFERWQIERNLGLPVLGTVGTV